MRERLMSLACATIGLVGVVASPAQAREFRAVILPMDASAIATAHFLPVPPGSVATVTDPSRKRAHHSYAVPTLVRYVGADDFLDPVRRGLQTRGAGMFDVYAKGASGMRVSGGAHYQMRYEADDSAPSGAGATMRVPGGAVALRDGYERYAPVAMVGYDQAVGERVKVGVEGGMMVGRATAMFGTSSLSSEMNVSRTASNPVADVVMTYRF